MAEEEASAALEEAVEAASVEEGAVEIVEVSPYTVLIIMFSGFQQGPPERVVVVAEVTHTCEGQIIAMCPAEGDIPLLARKIYNEQKQEIGKVDDVFGQKDAPGIAVNPNTQSGIQATSYKAGDKVSCG